MIRDCATLSRSHRPSRETIGNEDHIEPQSLAAYAFAMADSLALIRVLFIEDDERLGALTTRYLETHEMQVTRVTDGQRGLVEARRDTYDIVVLDLMLPGKSGMEVCLALRQRQDVPIIMVTARTEEIDRVLGLEAGADDYVTKPFSSRELVARIRAQVRRARGEVGPNVPEHTLRIGALSIRPSSMTVALAGRPIDVTSHEFALLHVLARNAGRVLSREQLLERARGNADEVFDRAIDIQISRLRAKLGDDARHPRLLKTIRGVGYMLMTGDAP